MAVTITLPEFQLPGEFPLVETNDRPWSAAELGALAERFGMTERPVDRGLWHVALSDSHLLEVYAASRSFRWAPIGRGSELDTATEAGLHPDKATERAFAFMKEFQPERTELVVRSVTESEVLISEKAQAEPRRLVLATEVNIGYVLDGHVGFVGPGAKTQVCLSADGEVLSAHRMWREVADAGSLQARSMDEVATAFGESATFQQLSDDTARVEVTSAVAGLYAMPPTETQGLFVPAVEVRGSITTVHTTVGFATYVAAVSRSDMRKALRAHDRRRQPVPSAIVA
jgi:hypothetical protein